jgi:hypothetical protein
MSFIPVMHYNFRYSNFIKYFYWSSFFNHTIGLPKMDGRNNVRLYDLVDGETEVAKEMEGGKKSSVNKRHKKADGTTISGDSFGSAASLEDGRQEQ